MSLELSQKFKKDYTLPMADTQDSQAAVHAAPGNISVQHVAKLMAAKGVSAVVVVEDLKPVGIVTSRDILVRVMSRSLDAAKVMVGAIMSSPLVTVLENGSVNEAIAVMGRRGVRRLPVVDEAGCLVTLLTLDDILRLNLADAGVLTDIVREQTRRAGDGPPNIKGPNVIRFADVPPPPILPKPVSVGTISGIARRSDVVTMVKRHPLRRLDFLVSAWYRRNRLPILLIVGASILGVAVTFYVSAFYGYKPAHYEPKEDSREIQMKQMELQELQRKQSERDRQGNSPDR
ncbi:MAG: CBS domain-containing protein [Nitrospirota bacterium]